MSETKENTIAKKPRSKALKWTAALLGIVLLEAGAIAASVKIVELQNTKEQNRLENISGQLAKQDGRLAVLEKLPASVTANAGQISSNFNTLTNLLEELHRLKEEVGNNKLNALNEKLSTINTRMESLEENKSTEALVLSLALIIKENAMYHRPFAKEVDILADLTKDEDKVAQDVATISRFKDMSLADNYALAAQFLQFEDNLSFAKKDDPAEQTATDAQKSTVSKSIELIKDTVAGINFDKVVVLKKDKKTGEQKLMLVMLENLVKSHNFADALQYIEENPELKEIDNAEFSAWQQQVRDKLEFETALSRLIAAQLSSLKQELLATTQPENIEKDNIAND